MPAMFARNVRCVAAVWLLMASLATGRDSPARDVATDGKVWHTLKRPQPVKLSIQVLEGEWGAPADNIQAVCISAGNELAQYFPDRPFEPITVARDTKQGPMVIYNKGSAGERRVLLNVTGAYWSQYSYQFAHELSHILCNYRSANNPQLWFEESMCETASLFVIRRMANRWRTSPPYPNWKSYAPSLKKYADDHMAKTPKVAEGSFADWFLRNEDNLKKTGTDRPLNQVVAVNGLLPLLEKEPRYWRAVAYLNQWDKSRVLTFREYLIDWRERVPKEHKAFVDLVAKRFGVSLES